MPPRTPLLHPREYFESRGFEFGPAALAVGVAAVTLAIVLLGFAILLSQRLQANGHPDAANAVWGIAGGQLIGLIGALLIGWLIVAGVLHLISRTTLSHEGSFGETMVIVGWGTAPTALTSVVAFVFISNALLNASMSSPDAFVSSFQSNLAALDGPRAILNFLLACWQTYLYGNGLTVAFDDRSGTPYLVGGTVAFVGWVLSLA
jgi:hypothetical protein